MAFIRFVAVVVICAAATFSNAQSSFAQGLSDASLTVGANWSRGYMGLGGHLGKAISKRTFGKKAVSQQRPRARKTHKVVAVAYRRDVTPLYLVSESLDPTGLNVAGLSIRFHGP